MDGAVLVRRDRDNAGQEWYWYRRHCSWGYAILEDQLLDCPPNNEEVVFVQVVRTMGAQVD